MKKPPLMYLESLPYYTFPEIIKNKELGIPKKDDFFIDYTFEITPDENNAKIIRIARITSTIKLFIKGQNIHYHFIYKSSFELIDKLSSLNTSQAYILFSKHFSNIEKYMQNVDFPKYRENNNRIPIINSFSDLPYLASEELALKFSEGDIQF